MTISVYVNDSKSEDKIFTVTERKLSLRTKQFEATNPSYETLQQYRNMWYREVFAPIVYKDN
jgi:hypothetical protein